MNEIDFKELYERNVDTIYRICYSYLKNKTDAEDVVQETFIKLLRKEVKFENYNHEKAWLIVTASNLCKNNLKSWKNKVENIEEYSFIKATEENEIDETLQIVLNLPNKYKTTIYLYYYEGYSSLEISKIIGKNESTVRTQLKRARKMLKEKIGGELDE